MALIIRDLQFTPIDHPTFAIENITLHDNEWLCIEGGNGSGKSTIASIIAGWVPTLLPGEIQGNIILNKEDILGRSVIELSSNIQYVQQAPQWQLSGCTFTVEEELTFGPENLAMDSTVILEQLEKILILMDLAHLRKRDPSTLSGGEMQRLMISSALMMQPELLILDESFSRMTLAYQMKILEQLKSLDSGKSMNVIILEKRQSEFMPFCEHLLILPKRG
ncbi:ABC transporter ATP-binding protein [Wohlfahrtiimonas larvae]|uniref:Energy-coupling factor ABC transporter ATP-binding protein n=1 Tax=Wohlfahrtiimonas larvae TaxID=1157986 RepID=A0ABP9MWE6_9GAMM|nr:ABC transporter ATP-binding protein [Wohlfahrtiimonas larvae]